MTGWGDRLKGLLGGKAKLEPGQRGDAKASSGKARRAPADRAAIMAAALAIHRRERVNALATLERTLKELKAKPPKPSDVAGMTRLLSLRQTVLNLKGHLAGGANREQVAAGIKGLLAGSAAPVKADPAAGPAKAPRPGSQKVPPKR